MDNESEYKKSLENVKNLSLGLILKQYVYSFLYWIYMQNPEYSEYLTPEDLTNYFLHKIDHDDLCYKLFVEHGFEWGGDWEHAKDYQHFEMPDEWIEKSSCRKM